MAVDQGLNRTVALIDVFTFSSLHSSFYVAIQMRFGNLTSGIFIFIFIFVSHLY